MSTDHFPAFATLVADYFQGITTDKDAVFVVGIDGDRMNEEYLKAFPEGTNPMFDKRTEHDCGICKSWMRRIGNVVKIKDGVVYTVWDAAAEPANYESTKHPYITVARALRDFVLAAPIVDIFRVHKNEGSFGKKQSTSEVKDEKGKFVRVRAWDHFYTGEIPKALRVESPDAVRGEYRTTVQVFERGLIELTMDALTTTLSLIDAEDEAKLYRGDEFRENVVKFANALDIWRKQPSDRAVTAFAWTAAKDIGLARFKNTVIGTLVKDLSDGMPVEDAVKAFEQKVAPTNYKRTTAPITAGMVKKATEKIAELGLEDALERRFARIDDISVNDVLWVDRGVRPAMKTSLGALGDSLMKEVKVSSRVLDLKHDGTIDIKLDDFVANHLKGADGIEIMFKGQHTGNLVSLTAPVKPSLNGGRLFRWNNDFAWSYGGNVADSIKERVKAAGGNIVGEMRFSLSWGNGDDLDIHVYEPAGRGVRGAYGDHIFFHAKRGWTGGQLDIDMNAGGPHSRTPVENVIWTSKPPDGAYRIVIDNYKKRESIDVGFTVEVENAGKISHFTYNKAMRETEKIIVCTAHVKDGVIVRFEEGHPGITTSAVSKEKWGLKTETFAKVNAVCFSPNYWQGAVRTVIEGDPGIHGAPSVAGIGNKHVFFFLDGAKSDEATRGIYNEFLHQRLEPHRKVFEIIGEKTKCAPTEGQLSGLGFSSTKTDSFVVRVTQGKSTRQFNVRVG